MMNRRGDVRLLTGKLLAIGIVLAVFFIFAGISPAAPKRAASAKPGDCAACHGQEKVLPPAHADTKKMAHKDCLGCHERTGPRTLQGKLPASHTHQLKGINCAACHGNVKKAEAVEMKQCLTCHNADKLVEKTAKVKPENPHTSPHYGNSLDCNLCHHQHSKSENYCAQCHDYKYKVP